MLSGQLASGGAICTECSRAPRRIKLQRPCRPVDYWQFFDSSCGSRTIKNTSRRQTSTFAQKGFGSAPQKSKGSGRSKGQGNGNKPGAGWYEVADATEFEGGKQTKSIIMPGNKQAIVVYRADGEVYCSDASSTAYQFPLSNAKVIRTGICTRCIGDGSHQVEVPLDGTIYELDTGKVVMWCPKNNPIRALLGTLKGNQNPTNLKVYPAQEDQDGRIYVQL